MLTLGFDPPAQHKVAANAQHDEERTQDNEVDVEPRSLHIHLTQYVRAQLDVAVVLVTIQSAPVQAIQRLQAALKRIPGENSPTKQVYGSIWMAAA